MSSLPNGSTENDRVNLNPPKSCSVNCFEVVASIVGGLFMMGLLVGWVMVVARVIPYHGHSGIVGFLLGVLLPVCLVGLTLLAIGYLIIRLHDYAEKRSNDTIEQSTDDSESKDGS